MNHSMRHVRTVGIMQMRQNLRVKWLRKFEQPDCSAFARGEAEYDMDNDPMWQHQAQAQPFESINFYQCDHLGTPQELTDMNGEVAWSAEYKVWGQAKEAISHAAKRAGVKNPIRFQGQYYDHETGLHYNRHRYYDPHSGRYLSKDPIGLMGGNVHAYARNPIQGLDPMGLQAYMCNNAGLSAWCPKTKSSYDILNDVYNDMQKWRLRDTDQFFHCIAFCRVSKSNAFDKKSALSWGEMKERRDKVLNFFGLYGDGNKRSSEEMDVDSARDLAVNEYGFSCPDNVSCADRCKGYVNSSHKKTIDVLKGKGYLNE